MMTANASYTATNAVQAKAAERRAHPRHPMVAPAEIKIAQMSKEGQSNAPVKAIMVDLSRGGCFLETSCPLALGTAAEIEVVKDAESFQAHARVVFTALNKGMGLEFTAVGPKEFKTLGMWLDKSLQDSWHAANRQRGQRIQLRIPVRVSGYNDQGARFEEETHTSEINPFGGSMTLSAQVKEGQRLVLSHKHTKGAVECLVVSSKQIEGKRSLVSLALISPNRRFWLVSFPPAKQFQPPPATHQTPKTMPRVHSVEVNELDLCLQA